MNRLYEQIMAHAASGPGTPALIEGNGPVSYGQLARLAEEQGAVLADAGVSGPDAVAIVAHKCSETIAAVLECLRQRRPFLLLSPLLPVSSRAATAAEAGCTGILHPADRRVELLQPDAGPVIPADVRFMLTTSGSTGRPKIVFLGLQETDNFAGWAAAAFTLRPATTVLSLAPLNFDLSLLDVWTTLACGGCVVLVPPAKAVDGSYVLAQVLEHKVEIIQGVPMFLQLLADAAAASRERADNPGSSSGHPYVRHVIFTGDEALPRTVDGMRHAFPEATIHNVYGCTETNDSLMYSLPPSRAVPERLPVGSPVAGAEVCLLDAEGREISGPGEGELLVHTPFMAAGYSDPQLTARKFVQHPRRHGITAFRSGDLFRRDSSGYLFLLGRTDHQVKVRGVAANTAEIERVIGLHQAVAAAAVMTEADPIGGSRLLAVVERSAGSTLSVLDLRTHCATHLPRTSIPAVIRITDTALPLTTTGKINRQQTQREYFPLTSQHPRAPQQGVLTP